jgi:hypothetical protein
VQRPLHRIRVWPASWERAIAVSPPYGVTPGLVIMAMPFRGSAYRVLLFLVFELFLTLEQ